MRTNFKGLVGEVDKIIQPPEQTIVLAGVGCPVHGPILPINVDTNDLEQLRKLLDQAASSRRPSPELGEKIKQAFDKLAIKEKITDFLDELFLYEGE